MIMNLEFIFERTLAYFKYLWYNEDVFWIFFFFVGENLWKFKLRQGRFMDAYDLEKFTDILVGKMPPHVYVILLHSCILTFTHHMWMG